MACRGGPGASRGSLIIPLKSTPVQPPFRRKEPSPPSRDERKRGGGIDRERDRQSERAREKEGGYIERERGERARERGEEGGREMQRDRERNCAFCPVNFKLDEGAQNGVFSWEARGASGVLHSHTSGHERKRVRAAQIRDDPAGAGFAEHEDS